MEYQVKVVGGIQSCYVSLPLSLIQHLDSSRFSSPLSHFVALELRPSASPNPRPWRVAWSGSASSSTAIEVAQEFAECLGIQDDITVLVRAISNVPKATTVTIEPWGEDDWEVLELNAEAAEAAMLNQVRLVHDAMRFPLWLHGQTIVTFLVVSTIPEKALVQLVPGTEVAVVPKRRRINNADDPHLQSTHAAYSTELALLRVQDPKKLLIHKSTASDVDIKIEVSSVVLIHPNTGQKYSFEPLQVVKVMPRLSSKEKIDSGGKDDAPRKKSIPSKRDPNDLTFEHEQVCRYAVVRILFSDKVAKGHIMVSQSLSCYLRADPHSWLYVQRFISGLKKNLPVFSVSPCQFVRFKQDPRNDGLEAADLGHTENRTLPLNSEADTSIPDWSAYHELNTAFPCEFFNKNDKDSSNHPNAQKMAYNLLKVWYMGQRDAIKSISGIESTTVVIGEKTFLHFEVMTSRSEGKQLRSATGSTDKKSGADKLVDETLFVLNPSEGKGDKSLWVYELSFGKEDNVHGPKFGIENIVLGDPVSFGFVKQQAFGEQFRLTVSDLTWINGAVNVTDRLMLLLSHASGLGYCELQFPLPGHVIISGPSGSGKSLLASAVAKSLEESHLLVHIVYVHCSRWASKSVKTVRQQLHECLSEALDHPPSLIVFDDFDSLVTSSLESEGHATSSSITELISTVMDELEESTLISCEMASIAFMACVRSLDSIPQSLRSSGRFDFHIELPPLAASGRVGILKHELQKRSLRCSDDTLHQLALKCEGYDSYDLELLVHRSIHAATSRLSPSEMNFEGGKPILIAEDFIQGMDQFIPVSMRDVTKSTLDNGRLGWEDVGGLADVRTAIIEMIEMPSKFPHIFSQSPLRMRSNVLLYGPPGCGKTHIVGAAAAGSSLRFISIKGPELLNKYIGSSEQAVRDVFSKAAAAAPCLLFFDEFDSIAPKRGHDNTGVTDRVVNQFLTELDGVEVLTGVFVFAATSRPDLIDAALLRPGRLDRLLFCDLPSLSDRLDILTVLSRKLRFGDGVDLMAIAHMTEGFSGADLQALLSDAQLAAVQEVIDNADKLRSKEVPVITSEMLQQVVSKARPSVSDSEKQRLYSIYSQFSNSKRSVAAQSRDKKGKRATLA